MSSATQNRRINIYINGKEIQNNMKSIRAEYRKSVAEINKMQRGSKEYQKQAKKIRELRGVMDQHRNDLGRATTAWGGLKNVVLGVFGGNLLMNGFNLLRRAVTGAINNIKEYQQANANLASILQVSREEIGALADESQRLGASTAFTATEVANLQTEFAKLGFTQNEIISATEATLALAAAARVDLAEAATVAGSTVRAFGLETTETQRVVDVMAQSFGDSALDFEKFRESMKYVAPVAKAAGISIEETTALLAQLSNAGISGSQAGTGLRRILNEIAKTGKPVKQALSDMAKEGFTLADAEDEVGKLAQSALLVLIDQADTLDEVTTGFEKAGGAAQRMADEQLDTLQGDLTILESTWSGFILAVENGEGVLGKAMRGLVQFTTSVVGALKQYSQFGVIAGKGFEESLDAISKSQSDGFMNRFIDGFKEGNLTLERANELLDARIEKIQKNIEDNSTFTSSGRKLEAQLEAQVKGLLKVKNALDESTQSKEVRLAVLEGEIKRTEDLVEIGKRQGTNVDELNLKLERSRALYETLQNPATEDNVTKRTEKATREMERLRREMEKFLKDYTTNIEEEDELGVESNNIPTIEGSAKEDFQDATRVLEEELEKRMELREEMDTLRRENDFDAEIEHWEGVLEVAQQMGADTTDIITRIQELKWQKATEKLTNYFSVAGQLAGTFFSLLTSGHQANLSSIRAEEEAELAKIDARQSREIISSEQSSKQKESIRAKYAKREKAEKQRQFKANQGAARVDAIINTAVAITKALGAASPVNFLLAALVGAQGLAQQALISKQSPPAYAGGTDSAPGGISLVGEAGPELVYLPQGSAVKTAGETEDILDSSPEVTPSGSTNATTAELASLNAKMSQLIAITANWPKTVSGDWRLDEFDNAKRRRDAMEEAVSI
jgi:hypothetical protein